MTTNAHVAALAAMTDSSQVAAYLAPLSKQELRDILTAYNTYPQWAAYGSRDSAATLRTTITRYHQTGFDHDAIMRCSTGRSWRP